MLQENKLQKLKQNKTFILTASSLLAVMGVFIFSGPKPNKDLSKVINDSKNKIILQDPNHGLKAEDRWLQNAEEKLDDYDQFAKDYVQDKGNLETRIADVEKKYEDTLSAQTEMIEAQGQEIEKLKSQASVAKPASADPNKPQDPFGNPNGIPNNRGIESIDFQLAPKPEIKEKGEFFKTSEYIPAGAYAEAVIISGVDASVGISAQSDPRPILLRIKGSAYSSVYEGNIQKADLNGCLLTGAASGDLSSEKVYIKLVNMTCAKSEDLVFETAIKGYVAGQGKSGVRGNVISREGDILAKSFLAGLVGGFGQGLSARVAPPLSFSSGVTLQNGYSNDDVVKKGLGQGFSNSGDRLQNYLITRAEQYQPVVSIPSGINVDVVFVEGFHLNGERHRKPTTSLNNRFINKFEAGQQQ